MPTFVPGHRLNSGPFGTMGVGLPFGIGAKIAKPDKQVIVVHGDGSFGLNALELDTAVRHNIPIPVVVSLNGGWTADLERNAAISAIRASTRWQNRSAVKFLPFSFSERLV
jgi:thiamine pyrophosphate-dependent acetolactate synthase large subunit-like protein